MDNFKQVLWGVHVGSEWFKLYQTLNHCTIEGRTTIANYPNFLEPLYHRRNNEYRLVSQCFRTCYSTGEKVWGGSTHPNLFKPLYSTALGEFNVGFGEVQGSSSHNISIHIQLID